MGIDSAVVPTEKELASSLCAHVWSRGVRWGSRARGYAAGWERLCCLCSGVGTERYGVEGRALMTRQKAWGEAACCMPAHVVGGGTTERQRGRKNEAAEPTPQRLGSRWSECETERRLQGLGAGGLDSLSVRQKDASKAWVLVGRASCMLTGGCRWRASASETTGYAAAALHAARRLQRTGPRPHMLLLGSSPITNGEIGRLPQPYPQRSN
eukprot:363913-Chlamydomonas_euryale.AAC.2